ncbi:hypothetical protein C0Q44_13505 [Paenibacillus sp. PCH8]|uniref:SPRY domain-containing protein n=1 Tax=Paenibacillus sp. PCH8 TaxID=2066524 RepID=UPI000CFA30D7|nr:SPRY domain-containing protein [Paenibacillus sp. PCH8]PQP82454.1 hypothetical protein C0Q44_13505 [Paenibacillus sp. PCH8]
MILLGKEMDKCMEILNVTLNPSDRSGNNSLSNGNLTNNFSSTPTQNANIRATHGRLSGKWYWEVKLNSGGIYVVVGISNMIRSISSNVESDPNTRTFVVGYKYPEGVPYGTAIAVNDVIGVALDLDNGTLEFYKNGVSMGVSHTNIKDLGEVYPFFRIANTVSSNITVNFGASSFQYEIPKRYYSFDARQVNFSNKILLSSGGNHYSLLKDFTDEDKSFVPILTASVDKSGIKTSASSSTDNAWKAFIKSTAWQSGTTTGWLRIQFPSKVLIGGFSMMGWANTSQNASKIVFRGSNDGVNWTVLDTFQSISWMISTRKYFIIKNEAQYSYFEFSDLASGANLTMSDIELYRRELNNVLIRTPAPIEELNYIKYGMEEVKFENIIKVNSLIKENTEMTSGKIFKHTIDMSKRRVDKITLG